MILSAICFPTSQDLWNLFIQIAGSAIGAGVAVWVYLHGNKAIETRLAKEKLRLEQDKMRYSFSLMAGTVKFTESLVKELKIFTAAIQTNPSKLPSLTLPPHNSVTRFVDKINQEEHYHSYRNQLPWGSSIITIFNHIDYIEGLRINILEQFTNVAKTNRERRNVYDSSLTEGNYLLGRHVQTIDVDNEVKAKLFFMFVRSVKVYAKISRTQDFVLIHNEYLQPLLKELNGYYYQTNDETYQDLFFKLSEAANAIGQYLHNLQFLKKSLEGDLITLEKAYYNLLKNLQSITAYIKEIDNKK